MVRVMVRMCVHRWCAPPTLTVISTGCVHPHHNHHHDHHHHHHHDHHHHHHHDHHHHDHYQDHRKCPEPTVCDALDFPRSQSLIGPVTYYVAEALSDTIRAGENPNRNPKRKPKEATP